MCTVVRGGATHQMTSWVDNTYNTAGASHLTTAVASPLTTTTGAPPLTTTAGAPHLTTLVT